MQFSAALALLAATLASASTHNLPTVTLQLGFGKETFTANDVLVLRNKNGDNILHVNEKLVSASIATTSGVDAKEVECLAFDKNGRHIGGRFSGFDIADFDGQGKEKPVLISKIVCKIVHH